MVEEVNRAWISGLRATDYNNHGVVLLSGHETDMVYMLAVEHYMQIAGRMYLNSWHYFKAKCVLCPFQFGSCYRCI